MNLQTGTTPSEWAATLPYGNGQIGMFGDSYFAVTATLAALAHPPHLAGVFVVFPASDYNDGFAYQEEPSSRSLWRVGLLL